MTRFAGEANAETPRAGVVLAGGFSTRFGEADKALAAVDGTPMLAHVVANLSVVVDEIVVSCRAEQQETYEAVLANHATEATVSYVCDPVPDRGPLAGLRTALQQVETDYVPVVACDMPGVDPAVIEHLFSRAAGADAAVPERSGGKLQPAQAVYHVQATNRCADRMLADDRRSLHAAIAGLDVETVPYDNLPTRANARCLRDLNTPAAVARFEGEE